MGIADDSEGGLMLDVLPKLLNELADDPDVASLVADRVRGMEPAPGDIQPKGKYKAFVVLTTLDSPRFTRAPVQIPRIGVRCYGTTPQNAFAVYAACSDAIHHIGPRLHANGLGIYISHDASGGSEEQDPVTKQPVYVFVAELIATTQAVAS